jgi:ABC transport system ATP-binding/permease protein
MWKLAIEDDEGKQTVVPLTRDEYTIGRKDGNTIRLTERNVSREHARIYKKNGDATPAPAAAIILEDLTSYNGVFVNGLRVSHSQNLTHGDLVQIGDYRLVLQDETTAEVPAPAATPNDAKQTVPGAPAAHARATATALLDRPNRLVMIAGPAPTAEFPLDRERMTIGRAEDASISVNHNSVSRIHCEVHALGDGRFEILDKGSSNGVRVNGADLRRGIVEPGDVIELGDVQFKFVGAGQIYRATESQKLAAISDRKAAEIVRRSRASMAIPVAIFAAVVVAGTIGVWTYTRHDSGPRPASGSTAASAPSPERAALDDAKALCAAGDCESARNKIEAAIPDGSSLRGTQDFKDIETKWADQLLARADAESDRTAKQAMYQRVSQAMGVDSARRKAAVDKIQLAQNTPETPPSVVVAPPPAVKPHEEAVSAAPHPEGTRRSPVAFAEPVVATTPAAAAPAAVPVATKPSAASVDDRERALALQGTQDSKVLLKRQLEQRVNNGKASDSEIKLLIGTCKDLGDRACVQAARAALAQKQE